MQMTAAINTMFSSVGVAFYFRFLVALLRDSTSRQTRSQSRPLSWRKRKQQVRWKAARESHAVLPIAELKPI